MTLAASTMATPEYRYPVAPSPAPATRQAMVRNKVMGFIVLAACSVGAPLVVQSDLRLHVILSNIAHTEAPSLCLMLHLPGASHRIGDGCLPRKLKERVKVPAKLS